MLLDLALCPVAPDSRVCAGVGVVPGASAGAGVGAREGAGAGAAIGYNLWSSESLPPAVAGALHDCRCRPSRLQVSKQPGNDHRLCGVSLAVVKHHASSGIT